MQVLRLWNSRTAIGLVVIGALVATSAEAKAPRKSSVTASLSAPVAVVGKTVRITGRVKGLGPRSHVLLQSQRGKSWRTVGRPLRARARNGSYSTKYRVTRVGLVRLRVRARGRGRTAFSGVLRLRGRSAALPNLAPAPGTSLQPTPERPEEPSAVEKVNTPGGDELPVGEVNGHRIGLQSGARIDEFLDVRSPNQRYRLVMQGDGNLVLYAGPRALWSTGTAGTSGNFAIMQADGNLVVYRPDGSAAWSSGTAGNPGARLYVQDDGNVVIYLGSSALWATSTVQHRLEAGDVLSANQWITSPDGRYRLIQQDDGNLVLYPPSGRALWSSATAGHPSATTAMQPDGNLVVYGGGGAPLWSSGTSGQPGAALAVQDDANVVLYRLGSAIWASGSRDSRLRSGQTLNSGQSIYSAGGAYRLAMQSDGNLVLYGPTGALWSTGSAGSGANRATLQSSDGNLVLYRANGSAVWSSGTAGHIGAELVVQDDGNTVMYASDRAVWATNTVQGSGAAPGSTAIAEQAARAAEARVGQVYTSENRNAGWWSGWCETFVALAYGNRFRYPSAIDHFYDYRNRGLIRGGVPPRGAIVFWSIGQWGHTAISVGGGQVIGTLGYSTDRKPVSRTSYTYFGNYAGWAMPY